VAAAMSGPEFGTEKAREAGAQCTRRLIWSRCECE
jgi:hypothetical protein